MTDGHLKILLVDDDEDDYIVTRDLLSEIKGETYDLEWIVTYDAALEAVKLNKYDVYLFDYRLGEKTGLELLREAVENGCNAPIILLTGQGDHEVDIEAMKAGASDYLIKGEINSHLLERSIRYAIERKRTEERILHMAYYDSLTNLPNRALLHDRLNQAIERAKRYKRKTAILFLDVDNFKRINDTLEHRTGDLLLKAFAQRLNKRIRKTDTLARYKNDKSTDTVARLGGDEFVVLLTEINSPEDAAKVAQNIMEMISQPFLLNDQEVFVTASIGIAISPNDGEDIDSLLKNADTAMYYAKDQGKNNFQFYKQSMNATAVERLTLENSLHKALEKAEFLINYQPQIDIITGEIVGMEALIRWENADKGLVSPEEFIPLAEETGLIIPIGSWVLMTACRQNKMWQEAGLPPFRVSVNISGKQFDKEGLLINIIEALDASGLEPQYLELEFTENIMMQDMETVTDTLLELKKIGVRLSINDFGSGYSSFSYLKRFPLNTIKIDSSFIKDVNNNTEDAAIVSAIIAMAHNLKLKVIADGVETEQQLAFLREHGCDHMQGYLLCQPMPGERVKEFFDKDLSEMTSQSIIKE